MIVHKFLKWVETAKVPERAAAANALARGYIQSEIDFEERCAAEAALTLLLDDPSPKVRAAMAEALSLSQKAPPQVISALATDQPEVAALVLVRSPLLTDAELIDIAAGGGAHSQRFISMRARLSRQVAAALAEVADADACAEMLDNDGAQIAAISFRRIVERHGHVAGVRERLLRNRALPADTRHALLEKLGETFAASPLLRALMGEKRTARVVKDACVKASMTLISNTPPVEFGALVEHLRLSGKLSTGFVVRTVAHGKIDFFGAILRNLSGASEQRIRDLLVSGRDNALRALLRDCGLGEAAFSVILRALKIWRDVATGKRQTGVQEVAWLMLKEAGGTPGSTVPPAAQNDDLVALLKSIYLEQLRQNARGHALALAAA